MREAWGYSMTGMATFLSLLGLVGYIAATITFAAAITWTVVRLVPPKKRETPTSAGS
jgi:hypothetical protein